MSSSQFAEVAWSSGLVLVWLVAVVPGALLGVLAVIDGRRREHSSAAHWVGFIGGWYVLAFTMAGGWTWQAAQVGIFTASGTTS